MEEENGLKLNWTLHNERSAEAGCALETTVTETNLGDTNIGTLALPQSLVVHQASALRLKWVEVHRLTSDHWP